MHIFSTIPYYSPMKTANAHVVLFERINGRTMIYVLKSGNFRIYNGSEILSSQRLEIVLKR